jgi:rhodanese-related sulfurtransferase
MMTVKKRLWTALIIALVALPALSQDKAKLMDELSGYLEFVDYGGGTIFAEQIPKNEYAKMMVIDARDAAQYAKEHIPGAVNIEWRQVIAKSGDIPKNKPVLIYCNTGSLSAQAGFALRVSGWENVRILQGGFSEWQSKGGLDANAKAAGASQKH